MLITSVCSASLAANGKHRPIFSKQPLKEKAYVSLTPTEILRTYFKERQLLEFTFFHQISALFYLNSSRSSENAIFFGILNLKFIRN